MLIPSKIQTHHLQKSAYVYLIQSTMRQVIHHPQSTERQYALKEKAQQLGWTASRHVVFLPTPSYLRFSNFHMHF